MANKSIAAPEFYQPVQLHSRLYSSQAAPAGDLNVRRISLNEWSPDVQNYLRRGSAIISVVGKCFGSANCNENYLGHGDHGLIFEVSIKEDIAKLKPCGNHRESFFTHRQYLKFGGFSDKIHQQQGLRRLRF